MSETIEQKCISKGIKLTDQRKVIAKVMSELRRHMGRPIILMLMNYIIGFLKSIQRSVLLRFIEL